MRRIIVISSLLIGVLTLTACAGPSRLITRRVVGITPANSAWDVIEAPASVVAGQPFVIIVTTVSNSCVRADGADVTIEGSVATITPYDRHSIRGECANIAGPFPRSVQLTFDTPGPAVIRVIGIDGAGLPLPPVEQRITVTP